MTYNVADLFAQRERERFAMHGRHLNEQMVRVLKAIGYDVGFCRGSSPALSASTIRARRRRPQA